MDYLKLTAPCGLDCFNCELYEENASPALLAAIAGKLGRKPEEVACKGCREQGGCSCLPDCLTLECVKSNKVDFCFECAMFPCEKLTPCSKGADKYPHNYKLYNLCRIKKTGLQTWAENEAAEIRKKYFKGKFIPGKGPLTD